MIADLQIVGYTSWKKMEYAQLGVWGNILWKYEVNPFSGLVGDVKTSFFNESKTDWLITDLQTDGYTY